MELTARIWWQTALTALILSLMGCALALTLAARWRLKGKPALRRRTVTGTVPPLGSAGLIVGGVVALAWSAPALLQHGVWAGWLCGSVWIVLVGLVDDLLWELPPWVKAAGQVAGAVTLMVTGLGMHIVHVPEWLNLLLSLLWIVGLTNAINLLDILDGLAAAVTAVAAATFAVIAHWAGQPTVALVALALTGALLGFLAFNWPPAKLYMGDAGSQWLGFSLAAVSLAISYAPLGREVALATPLIVLGLPVYDLAFVTWMRLRGGRSPFKKSRDHFALRLASAKGGSSKAVLAMAMLAAGFGAVGLYLSRASNGPGLVAILSLLGIMLVWGRQLAMVNVDGSAK